MNNNIIRVHRPELTTEEREKRMNQIKEAATRLYVAYEREASVRTKSDMKHAESVG